MMTLTPASDTNVKDPERTFNLRRYFSAFSFGIIIILTLVLSTLVYWNQRHSLIAYSTSSAVMFAHQVNAGISEKFIDSNLLEGDNLQIGNDTFLLLQLNDVAETFLKEYGDIRKIKIFNLDGKVIYSTESKDVGLSSNTEGLTKALSGRTDSVLTSRETVFGENVSDEGEGNKLDILKVYIPVYRNPDAPSSGEIIGAFEVYKDVGIISSLMKKEFYKIPLLLLFSMGALYLFLQVVIKKAAAIIRKQNEEIDLHNAELVEAQQRIKKAIDEVIENESFHVRLHCDNLLKCWEVKNCQHTECPSYKSQNLRCWQISGTFCGGKVQGYFANKYGDCRKCDVYRNAFKDRINMIGESFNNMMVLLESKHMQLQKLNETLNVLIDTDPLTEVGNRRSFQKRMENIHLLSLRYNHPYSIIICDVDNFKSYNDTYGHQKGDYALVSIAKTMKTSIRRTDEIFRWGGEEFIIILTEQNLLSALKVADNLRAEVEAQGIPHKGCDRKMLTISAGVACNFADNVKYIMWENVIKQADDELYKAKASGKNRICPSTTIDNVSKLT
ncbi:MAG: GGDEF domain-containing protein [Nitrospiraceae bacterium]|nr:MAG: GGDEF domain-containing protein [Nitrospiraceae bacterium]